MRKKLYTGNLSFEVSEAELKKWFGGLDQVEIVRIVADDDTGDSITDVRSVPLSQRSSSKTKIRMLDQYASSRILTDSNSEI